MRPLSAFNFIQPEWLDEVASTNTTLKSRLDTQGLPRGTVLAAHRQTQGRGRMGTSWHSASRGDLHFSFYWSGNTDTVTAGTLPLACALAVMDFLRRKGWLLEARYKWPNDVLVGDDKICGILTEGGIKDGIYHLIIGIGINLCSLPERDATLARSTVAVEDFTGQAEEATQLLPELLSCLTARIQQWENGGFSAIRPDLEHCLWGIGRNICAKSTQGEVCGRVAGLGQNGELQLRQSTNELISIASATALQAGWEPNSPEADHCS